jgi:hypothetical protein
MLMLIFVYNHLNYYLLAFMTISSVDLVWRCRQDSEWIG